MAFNPPLTPAGIPFRVDNEVFVLQRQNMEIEVKIDGGWKKTGNGKIFLTSCRIVFINEKFATSDFKSFDIPLLNLTHEKFEQPVFGSNYLSGDVAPLFNLIPAPAKFRLWFKSGGCGTFLKMIDQLLNQVRKRQNQGHQGPDPRFLEQVRQGNISNQQGLFDPNDPSVIYVTQPQNNYDPNQNNQFYGQQGNPYYPQQQQQQQPYPPLQQQPQQQPFQPPQKQQEQPQQMNQPQQYNYPPQLQFQPLPNQQYQQYNQNQQTYQQYQPPQQQQQQTPLQMNQPLQQQYPNSNYNPDAQNQQYRDQQQQGQYFGYFGPGLQGNNDQNNNR